jgi:hypothetical protein
LPPPLKSWKSQESGWFLACLPSCLGPMTGVLEDKTLAQSGGCSPELRSEPHLQSHPVWEYSSPAVCWVPPPGCLTPAVCWVHLSAPAAMTVSQMRAQRLKGQKFIFSQFWKFEVSQSWVPEASVLGWQVSSSLCVHTRYPFLCLCLYLFLQCQLSY